MTKIILYVVLAIVLILIGKAILYTGDSIDKIRNSKDYKGLKLVYSRNNGSLPPLYYRSYIITVVKDAEGVITGESVTSDYEKVLETKTLSIDDGQFSLLMSEALQVGAQSPDTLNDCTGGSEKSLEVFKNQKTILKTSSYSCGGKATLERLEKFDLEINDILNRVVE